MSHDVSTPPAADDARLQWGTLSITPLLPGIPLSVVDSKLTPELSEFLQQWEACIADRVRTMSLTRGTVIRTPWEPPVVVTVPEGLTSAEQIIAFVRDKITELGGDPDSAYLCGVESQHLTDENALSVVYTFDYDRA